MQRIIHLGLLFSSLGCYLEWADQSAFLFEMEFHLIFRTNQELSAFSHPLIVIPLLGQAILVFCIFKKEPPFKLTVMAVAFLGLLVLIILLAGILSTNIRIIGSVLPFMLISIMAFLYHSRKIRKG